MEAGALVAELLLYPSGVYIEHDCSALTFTDRTKAPKGKPESFAIINSFARKDGKLDKDKLDKSAVVEGEITNPDGTKTKWVGRDLSLVVSALMEVAKDLTERVAALEA